MNSFTEQGNLDLIWKLMDEFVLRLHGVTVNDQNIPGFKQFFIDTIDGINNTRYEYNNDLKTLNEVVLSRLAQYIQQNIIIEKSSKNLISTDIRLQYERKQDVTSNINNSMKTHEDNFNSYQAKVPSKIDFSDQPDEFSVNKNFDQTLVDRELELKKITSEYNSEAAKTWIDVEPQPIQKKRVSFEINEQGEKSPGNIVDSGNVSTILPVKTFLSKLKVKTEKEEDFDTRLINLKSIVNDLKKTQDEILNKLDLLISTHKNKPI